MEKKFSRFGGKQQIFRRKKTEIIMKATHTHTKKPVQLSPVILLPKICRLLSSSYSKFVKFNTRCVQFVVKNSKLLLVELVREILDVVYL